jgi:hypothetical protein
MDSTPFIDHEAQLKADYADLGVSCGYIGNIWHGPTTDDRSFRVFTQVQVKKMAFCSYKGTFTRETWERAMIHIFDVPRTHKGVWQEKVQFDTPEVRAKLDALRALVAAGEAFVR